jgi:two-component system cell cycle sensor histidine kinase/response regulator CckA
MSDPKLKAAHGGTQTESRSEDNALDDGYKILRTILRAAPIGIGMVRNRVFLHVNKWFCEMTGFSREELLNRDSIMVYASEEEYRRVGEEKYRQITEHGHGSVETQLAHKDGHLIDVYLSSMPIDTENLSKGVVFTALDITERKQAETLLRDAQQRFKDLAYMLPQTVFELDMEGRIAYMNRYGLEALGYAENDIEAGISATDMIVPEDRERLADSIRRNLAGEFITGNEYNAIRKDGSSVPIVTYASPIKKGNKIVGLRGLAVDISERKGLEEQLRQSQKMEAVGRLAGGLAHDFNNLLTGILGYSQLALESIEEDHPARDLVETIKKTGENATELTDRLLTFSRRKPINRRIFNLNETVSGMDEMLAHLIGEDIRFSKVLQPDLFNVQGDPNEIEHVILNLAINARDAMPQGGELVIETRNVSVTERSGPELVGIDPGKYAMLAVSDTGVGMTDEVKSRVFEPFFTTKPNPKGTGLGMSIVYGIVTQNGGRVWIRSSPGRGATVRIYFPRVNKPVESGGVVTAVPKSLKGSETVLLVEDQEVVRSLAVRILRGKGYSVLEAGDGKEALKVSGSHEGPIHLMVTDVVMPGMGGAELAQRMAKARPDTEIIYMSGYTDDEIVRHGVIDEGKTLIQKPFTRELFTLKVRMALDKAALRK